MTKLMLSFLFFAILAVLPATAQNTNSASSVIANIAQKYQTLDAQATEVKANGATVAKTTRFIQPDDEAVADYSNLRQIALVRHGEPDVEKTGKFSYEEARAFQLSYDSVGIVVPEKPFFNIENPDDVAIFSSSLNRAHSTAQYLFGDSAQMTVSPQFREFETNVGKHNIKFRLPIKLWTTSARIKWMLGIDSKGVESFSAARQRANKAAEMLDQATDEKQKVVLVAHGFLNRYIKSDLEKMGWRVVRDGGSDYFATTILVKLDEPRTKQPQNDHIALNTSK